MPRSFHDSVIGRYPESPEAGLHKMDIGPRRFLVFACAPHNDDQVLCCDLRTVRSVSELADTDSGHSWGLEQNSNAITNEQARGVKLGTTRGAVESKFGPRKSDQESTNEGLGDDSCIYYNLKGGELLDQWQFCFGGAGESGKLRSKNRL